MLNAYSMGCSEWHRSAKQLRGCLTVSHRLTTLTSMHWFWRATIAAGFSFVTTTVVRAVLALSLPMSVFANPYLHVAMGIVFTVIPITVYGLLTYWFAPVHREYRRRKKGLCVKCSYNLTGNVSGVCPECGEKI